LTALDAWPPTVIRSSAGAWCNHLYTGYNHYQSFSRGL